MTSEVQVLEFSRSPRCYREFVLGFAQRAFGMGADEVEPLHNCSPKFLLGPGIAVTMNAAREMMLRPRHVVIFPELVEEFLSTLQLSIPSRDNVRLRSQRTMRVTLIISI